MNDALKQEVALRDKTHLLPDVAFPADDKLYGYEKALSAAGATVLGFEQFGSYQGEWWSEVQFPNGERYFVNGCYGSCSGCDAFEAEFGWNAEDEPNYLHKLRDFGREYLTNCFTQEQALAEASKNLDWDSGAQEMVDWIKGRRTPQVTEPPHD